MKKNLISIMILALLVVNLVLTSIMMFSVTSSVKKTSALVTNIASILNIELSGAGSNTTTEDTTVSVLDAVPHLIDGELTIPLKRAEGEEKTHYCLVEVSFYMNSKHEEYATFSTTISNYDIMLKDIVIEVIGNYTADEALNNKDKVKADILQRVQSKFGTVIYEVGFGKYIIQ